MLPGGGIRFYGAYRRDVTPPASGGVKNPGVAGAFIGGIGERIVVAGGSNFAQGAPWDGGAKQFEDAIYLLTPSGDACKCELAADAKLPRGYRPRLRRRCRP